MNRETKYFCASGIGIDEGVAWRIQNMFNEARAQAAMTSPNPAKELDLLHDPSSPFSSVLVRTQHTMGGRGWRKRRARERRLSRQTKGEMA